VGEPTAFKLIKSYAKNSNARSLTLDLLRGLQVPNLKENLLPIYKLKIEEKDDIATTEELNSIIEDANTFTFAPYWTSWSRIDPLLTPDLTTHLYLAFAEVKKSGNSYTVIGSDNYLAQPDNANHASVQWRQYKKQHPDAVILLPFGGLANPFIWKSQILENGAVDKIAKAMADTINAKQPVYSNKAYPYGETGETIEIDGIDLDFELEGARPTREMQIKVKELVLRLRKLLKPGKLITLTTLHVAADPVECRQESTNPLCSYQPGSLHAGEQLDLLRDQEFMSNIDMVNVMAYDAASKYPFDVGIDNYQKEIGGNKKKVVLGLDTTKQWDPNDPSFYESASELQYRAYYQYVNGYRGVMFWQLANKSIPNSTEREIDKIIAVANVFTKRLDIFHRDGAILTILHYKRVGEIDKIDIDLLRKAGLANLDQAYIDDYRNIILTKDENGLNTYDKLSDAFVPRSAQTMITINSNFLTLNKIVDDTTTISVNGGDGTGSLVATSSDSTIVSTTINGNSVILSYLKGGDANINIYKDRSSGYFKSNDINITVHVNKKDQSLITIDSSTTITAEALSNKFIINVSNGNGTGNIVATSSNSSIVGTYVNGSKVYLEYKSEGNTSVHIKKSGDDKYNDSNTIDIDIIVTPSTKQTQNRLSVDQNSYSGFVGESFTPIFSGGSGSGDIILESNNTSIAQIINNSIKLVGEGQTSVSAYKRGDNRYQMSNKIIIDIDCRPTVVDSDDFDLRLDVNFTTNTIEGFFTNITSHSLDLYDYNITISSPIRLNFDLKAINGATSYPTTQILSSTSENGAFITKLNVTVYDGGELVLDPGESVGFTVWAFSTGLDKKDFKIIKIDKPAWLVPGNKADLPLLMRDDPVSLKVRGWPNIVSMGTITDASTNSSLISNLASSKIEAIFKYVGDGAGDRDKIIDDSVTRQTIRQARDIEAKNGNKIVRPVMVVYTAQASSAASGDTDSIGGADIKNREILKKHFINLIRTALALQNSKDATHPYPGSIILNPDLLGEWLLSSYKTTKEFKTIFGSKGKYKTVDIKSPLRDAIDYVSQNDGVTLSNTLPSEITDDILGFIQAHNYIIHTFAPDVTFGWQQNIWPLGKFGSVNWVRTRYKSNLHLWNEVTAQSAKFLDDLNIYKGRYKPDFIVFDKYEFDGLSGGAKSAYAFNSLDWENYLLFVKQLTDYLDTPAMLWQIPGGHMATVNENISSNWITSHSATGGTYFMGDTNIGHDISNIKDEVLDISLSSSTYNGKSSVRSYLQEDSNFNWGASHIREAAFSNVFSILWGGGNTASVVPVLASGDDGEWLKSRVKEYYDNGGVKIYHKQTSGNNANANVNSIVPGYFDNKIIGKDNTMNTQVFTLLGSGKPSTIYKWGDFLKAVKLMYDIGVSGYKLWLGGDASETDSNGRPTTKEQRAKYGLVNLAAFLAQSKKRDNSV